MVKPIFNFKKTFEELQNISEWFEQPDIDLDEALKKFQRGQELLQLARTHLKATENEFKKIKKDAE